MEALGFPGGNVSVVDAGDQAKLWTVRSAGLNIVSSTRGDPKPISVIEDCAVPLKHLAAYTARLTRLFEKHGTHGTWYAHASVGCLHVRPVLNMKSDLDVRKLRPSPRRPSPSCGSTGEATPASTGTGSSGASSTPRCSAPSSSAPSRR
jgi:hypothetical protein